MASDHIPDDLFPKILKCLPVKTLIKFQCVCNTWNSLLSSRFFTDDHFNSTTKTAEPPTYLRQRGKRGKRKASYILHKQDNTTTNVDFPLLRRQHLVTSFQVIHGVVCLTYVFKNHDRRLLYNPILISFRNPIVRKHVTTCTRFESACNFSGFGFDSSNNDFKAVWSPIKSIYCEVFSARDGNWRKMKQPKCVDSLFFGSDSCHMNGTIHWVTYKFEESYLDLLYPLLELGGIIRRPHGLLLFECERKEFTTIELPKLVGDILGDAKVFEYFGLLSLLISGWRGGTMVCELWTMNESTWTKMVDYGVSINTSCQLDCDYKEIDVHMLGRSAYVFEESMLLMDIGQPLQD